LAGAFDGLRPWMDRRRRLWQLHELWPLVSPQRARGTGRQRARGVAEPEEPVEQMTLEWMLTLEDVAEMPSLPALNEEERQALDYRLLGLSARPHPLRLQRRELSRRGIRAIAELADIPAGRVVRVAGWPISAQRPPTAHGMGFVVLEDETGRLPVALPPKLAVQMHRVIRTSRVVVVSGRLERVRWYHSVLGFDLEGAA
jgi:error-prone DNA polymerase